LVDAGSRSYRPNLNVTEIFWVIEKFQISDRSTYTIFHSLPWLT